MSFTDALTQIADIQSQIAALTGGPATAGAATSTAPASSVAPSTGTAGALTPAGSTGSGVAGSDGSASFAAALLEAQTTGAGASAILGSGDGDGDAGLDGLGGTGSATADPLAASGSTESSLLPALLDGALGTGTSGLTGELGTSGNATGLAAGGSVDGGAGLSSGLPANATSLLTSDQQQFAGALVAQTGLNPSVVTAWLLAEESGGAAQSRQAAHNNDWLNIGYTDTGTDGAGDAVWSDPVSAAAATAGWLKGQATIPGYGTASPSIQSILATVGSTPAAQLSALQSSGWASSGYPDLPSLYAEVSA